MVVKREDRRKMEPEDEGSGEQTAMGGTHTEIVCGDIEKESMENRRGW